MLYDNLARKQASSLAQLRTGMARLNSNLYRIGAAESDRCIRRRSKETIGDFLFRCSEWDMQRRELLAQIDMRRRNLSLHLGGQTCEDSSEWTPNIAAAKATIKYAISTGQLDTDTQNQHAGHFLPNHLTHAPSCRQQETLHLPKIGRRALGTKASRGSATHSPRESNVKV